MAKSLHDIKMEEQRKTRANIVTDSDYFLRDKDTENGINTLDITGATNNSAEEALTKKLLELELKIASMTKLAEARELADSEYVKQTKLKKDGDK